MARHMLGFGLDEARKMRIKCASDACVQLLTLGAQQSAVGGILNQRMLERIDGLGWGSPAEDQFGRDKQL